MSETIRVSHPSLRHFCAHLSLRLVSFDWACSRWFIIVFNEYKQMVLASLMAVFVVLLCQVSPQLSFFFLAGLSMIHKCMYAGLALDSGDTCISQRLGLE